MEFWGQTQCNPREIHREQSGIGVCLSNSISVTSQFCASELLTTALLLQHRIPKNKKKNLVKYTDVHRSRDSSVAIAMSWMTGV
jgi:hypothetical protein